MYEQLEFDFSYAESQYQKMRQQEMDEVMAVMYEAMISGDS